MENTTFRITTDKKYELALERSTDLKTWQQVQWISTPAEEMELVDSLPDDQDKYFYRVISYGDF